MPVYSYSMFLYLHSARWHSSATIPEDFPFFFLSCKANARVKSAKTGHGPHSSKKNCVVLGIVCFVSFCGLCVCVCFFCANVYRTTVTGWLPNCS